MQITTPIPGLDNFMIVEDSNGVTRKVMFEQSTKFQHVARPGAQHKTLTGLGLDFIIRAKSPEGAIDLMDAVWG